MTARHNLIKEIARLYSGHSFYYSDFLSLKEATYNNNLGYSENYYNRVRVIEKNNIGEVFTKNRTGNTKELISMALLNSRVASVLPSEKVRVYYPYIHTFSKVSKDLTYKNIKKINYKIKLFEKKYRPDYLDFTIRKSSKIIVSNIGSVIEQDFLTVKFAVKVNGRNYFEHYKINNFTDIDFPVVNSRKFRILSGNYDLFLSPRVVAKTALFLFDNNFDMDSLKLMINPYLYKGVQANLYDDEGTFRIKSVYKGLTGGNIFQNDTSCGYFYDFNRHNFILRQPDLEIEGGEFNIRDFKEDYLLVNDFDKIDISYGKIVINADLSLIGKGKSQGYMTKKIEFPMGELKNIKKFTKLTKVSGLDDSSVKAPYIYLGRNYEL